MTDDEKVAHRYRELGREEPPRALDDAILAAARRGRPRSYAPLATAAVLVLAVAVTLNMQLERPGIESPAPQLAPQRAGQPPAAASSAEAKVELKLKATADLKLVPKPATETGTSARRKDAGQSAPASVPAPAPAAPVAREPQPFAANQAPARAAARADDARDARGPASSVTGELARQIEERTSRDVEAAERAPRMGAIQSLAKRAEPADTPERELERIAELRGQGRHEDADKALAEFRKRNPGYRISDAIRERVERR